MTKVNKETMKSQYDGQYETFCRKNHDYGNSFEESLDQFGIVASIVRMSDKMKRLESLTDESKTQQVGSESLLDTLEDLSNYAAMTACWLKGVCDEDEVSGPNIEDIMLRSAEMEKEFNKHIPIMTFEDMDIEFVSLLKLIEKFHHKIEEFKMTEADHKELEEIINRLRSIIQDAPISKEGIVSLIKKHVLLNPDVLIHQLFNQPEDKVKHFLKDLYVTVFAFRDHCVPIVTQLEYLERKKEICNKLAKIVLNGLVDFGTITAAVNSSTELHKHEKKDILESIVSAAYEIDSENFSGDNHDSEFLNKKFHIPDKVLEDLKNPKEKEGYGDKLLNVLLWFLPLNKEY